MKCPACPETTLVMSDRQGVEIDYCPNCRGIWLDRGELDKLLDRAAPSHPGAAATAPATAPAAHARGDKPDFEDSDFSHQQRYPRGQKKSWLHDIFN